MNQELKDYFETIEFRQFCDTELYAMACTAVERIIEEMRLGQERPKMAKRSQIHSISSIVQALQIDGLIELAKNQKDKNSKAENKLFWTLIYQHLEDLNDQTALKPFARRFLTERQIVKDEKKIENKAEQGRQKSLNNEAIREFLNTIAPVYFEHFTSHYYYRTTGASNG